jgi:hypothetical protein
MEEGVSVMPEESGIQSRTSSPQLGFVVPGSAEDISDIRHEMADKR